ncbi:MAG: hypothetical protein MJA30_17335 [Cytophagales bacterium]|nr:hypothetical protein [Cytophagales bacterium]
MIIKKAQVTNLRQLWAAMLNPTDTLRNEERKDRRSSFQGVTVMALVSLRM